MLLPLGSPAPPPLARPRRPQLVDDGRPGWVKPVRVSFGGGFGALRRLPCYIIRSIQSPHVWMRVLRPRRRPAAMHPWRSLKLGKSCQTGAPGPAWAMGADASCASALGVGEGDGFIPSLLRLAVPRIKSTAALSCVTIKSSRNFSWMEIQVLLVL